MASLFWLLEKAGLLGHSLGLGFREVRGLRKFGVQCKGLKLKVQGFAGLGAWGFRASRA